MSGENLIKIGNRFGHPFLAVLEWGVKDSNSFLRRIGFKQLQDMGDAAKHITETLLSMITSQNYKYVQEPKNIKTLESALKHFVSIIKPQSPIQLIKLIAMVAHQVDCVETMLQALGAHDGFGIYSPGNKKLFSKAIAEMDKREYLHPREDFVKAVKWSEEDARKFLDSIGIKITHESGPLLIPALAMLSVITDRDHTYVTDVSKFNRLTEALASHVRQNQCETTMDVIVTADKLRDKHKKFAEVDGDYMIDLLTNNKLPILKKSEKDSKSSLSNNDASSSSRNSGQSQANQIFTSKKSNPVTLYVQAVKKYKEGNYQGALLDVIEARRLFIERSEKLEPILKCLSTMTSCYRQLKKYKKAINTANEAIQTFSEKGLDVSGVVKKHDECLDLQGASLEAIYNQARKLYGEQQYHLAKCKLNYVLDRASKSSKLEACCHSSLVSCCRELKDFVSARKHCEEALSLFRKEPQKNQKLIEQTEKKLNNLPETISKITMETTTK